MRRLGGFGTRMADTNAKVVAPSGQGGSVSQVARRLNIAFLDRQPPDYRSRRSIGYSAVERWLRPSRIPVSARRAPKASCLGSELAFVTPLTSQPLPPTHIYLRVIRGQALTGVYPRQCCAPRNCCRAPTRLANADTMLSMGNGF